MITPRLTGWLRFHSSSPPTARVRQGLFWLASLLIAFVPPGVLRAQSIYATPYTFTTFAGSTGRNGQADGTGAAAQFYSPSAVAVDGSGNIFVADTMNQTIRKITPAGVVTTLAGTAGSYGSADGTGAAAQFTAPTGVAVDGDGNVFVADSGNHTIRKITPAGVVTTFAGTAGNTGQANGTGAAASFNWPRGVAVDGSGNVFVADTFNNTIRKITPAGVVTTLAGTAGANNSGQADGAGAAARFSSPSGITVDGSGNVYVADTGASTIRKITPAGIVTTLAGTFAERASVDGTGAAARFNDPNGVAVDGSGNVFVADTMNRTIRKITPNGVVTTLVGTAGVIGHADGTGAAVSFGYPNGVAVDAAGNLFVADTFNSTIRKITPDGVVSTLAGTASGSGNGDGAGAAASFTQPAGVAVDAAGNVYVADTSNNSIRKITPDGGVTTLAVIPPMGGIYYKYSNPTGVAVDAAGNVYLAEPSNNRIQKVTPSGVVSSLAGNTTPNPALPAIPGPFGGTIPDPSNKGFTDGPGGTARFNGPAGVAVDSAGNVYVADTGNRSIRKITSAGNVTTLDGTGAPGSIAVDASGNLYVTDNGTIRKVTPDGVATTIAGKTNTQGSADGPASEARFSSPSGVAVDSSGNVFVADTYNHTIRKITPEGMVITLAGLVGSSGSTDGTGSVARFSSPRGVAVDSAGNVFVADTGNSRIRKGTLAITKAAQTITFADPGSHNFGAAPFALSATSSSGLPVSFSVVSGPATLSGSTVTLTGPGTVTIRASQPGNAGFDAAPEVDRSFTVNPATAIAATVPIPLADFDGDGCVELLWRNSLSTQIASWTMAGAYLNFGPESGGWAVVTVGDFDGDGRTEPLWRNSLSTQIASWTMAGAYLNFGPESGGWAVVTVGDFDGDGRAEPLWRNSLSTQIASWTMAGAYLNFGPESGGWAVVTVGDFDGDGRAEPLWRNSTSTQIASWTMAGAYLNFGPESGGWSVVTVGDFDGDGRTEPLWRNSTSTQIASWTMAGTYLNFGPESDGWSVVTVGDFDGDGRTEPLWRNSLSTQIACWTMAGAYLNFGPESGGWAVVR